MNTVLRHIEFLLSSHDCVIVPGLGAFLAENQEAQYDANNNVFNAPCRRFAFNRQLDNNDGMITMSIARSKALDYNAASRIVSDGVSQIKNELRRTGEVCIGRLGRLTLSKNTLIQFAPYPGDMISPLSNWIGNLKIKDIETIKAQADIDNADKNGLRSEIQKILSNQRKIKLFVRSAIGAAAAILIAILVSTPVKVDTYTASTVPNVTSPKAIEVPITASAQSENGTNQAEEAPESETVRFNVSDPYIVVVGAFFTLDDTNVFISQHSGKNLNFDVVKCGNHYRIYSASGQNAAEAYQQISRPEIRENFKSAWVAKR